ncbi:hypothetical protein LEP1GSC052_2576 [Leptospira kmetyi serovar Malaysia str. Bejo-Iso9]|nr:hypothetical protein LEP1GSC052_2576 [Leptospira kmetyi serovar Malaysia str. Bejo-Iso9]
MFSFDYNGFIKCNMEIRKIPLIENRSILPIVAKYNFDCDRI